MSVTSPLKILPLGGLGEIGMNCMVLEYEDEILIVDCGLMFSDLDHFGVEFVIPDFSYLVERKEKIKAFLITHGHEDHVGALPFALKAGVRAPIYASPFSSMLIRARMEENGLNPEIKTFKPGESFAFKHFKVDTISVNHSIIDAAAMIIHTPHGKIIHTGDFKIDKNPFYGSELDEGFFKKAGDDGVLLLLSDSTNVERHEESDSECIIEDKFEEVLAAAEGLVLIAMFASNVSRVGQVMKLAAKMGKKVAVGGRSMEQNVRHAQELGYLEHARQVQIGLDEVKSLPRDQVVVLSSGSQAEFGSALQRISHGEHKHIHVGAGDQVILSSRHIPGNEKAIGRMVNQLFKQGADVLYGSVDRIHVSGHATRPELKRMIEWTRPKFFLPIHGEYRHLVHHARLAEEAGVPKENVLIAVNGHRMEITQDRFETVEILEEPKVLVEGREGNEMTDLVLRDRRQIGERGVVFVIIVRNLESRLIIAGPEIIAKGIAASDREGFLIEEGKKLVMKLVGNYEDALDRGEGESDLQETIRIELRRFFNTNLGKKPTVLPMILDL